MVENSNNFLQSDIWRQFQEAVGHKTFMIKEGNFSASIVEHKLPVVGKYCYCPRGPKIEILNPKSQIPNKFKIQNSKFKILFSELIDLAKKNNAGWVRIDPENNQVLELIKNNISLPIKKAPHDMQPREILVMDITKTEEELLGAMKSKTRYNINLAQKRGVSIRVMSNVKGQISNQIQNPNDKISKYISEFIRLVKLTEKRKRISFHPGNYYRKMLEVIPENVIKLYIAEYKNKVIAANLVIFYGDTATYLHGAMDDEYRNVMAPYLLQWQAIKDAKNAGCKFYDFGGVKTEIQNSVNWSGITKFKLGFAPTTESIKFSGSYDIIINKRRYYLYRIIQKIKNVSHVALGKIF